MEPLQQTSLHIRQGQIQQDQKLSKEDQLRAVSGNLSGRVVVQLVGKNNNAEVFTATMQGRVPSSEHNLKELLANRNFIPIPIREIRNIKEAAELTHYEIVFLKVDELATTIGARPREIERINRILEGGFPVESQLMQVKHQLSSTLDRQIFFKKIRESVLEKWSLPIEDHTLNRANNFITQHKPMDFTDELSNRLVLARTGGSTTIASNASKQKDWLNAEKLIKDKAGRDESLTLEDLCTLNGLINGSDNPTIKGGVLRDGPMHVGGFGGLSYMHQDHVKPLMEKVFKSMNEGILNKENPIVLAAKTYQKLVSIHPFEDGNGRTCRLVMDYVLIRHKILPPSLEGDELLVAIFGQQGEKNSLRPLVSPSDAVEKILAGIQRTYDNL